MVKTKNISFTSSQKPDKTKKHLDGNISQIIKKKIPQASIPKDKYVITSIQISLFLIFLSLGFFLFYLLTNHLPPEVPLYYSQSWGKNQLAGKYELLILPISSLVVFFINFTLARLFYQNHKILARILLGFSSLFSFLATVTFYQIITLVS